MKRLPIMLSLALLLACKPTGTSTRRSSSAASSSAMPSGTAASGTAASSAAASSAAASGSSASKLPQPVFLGTVWGKTAETLAAWCQLECDGFNRVGLWDTKTGKLKGQVEHEAAGARRGVAIISDDRMIVSHGGTLGIFDRFVLKRSIESYLVYHRLSVSPDRKHLLWTNGYGVRALDFRRLTKVVGHDFHTADAMHAMRIHWAPDSGKAAVDHDYDAVILVDVRARRRAVVNVPGSKTPGATDVAWATNSRELYVAQADGAVARVDAKTGGVKQVLRKPARELGSGTPRIALSPDGTAVAVSEADTGVFLWVDGTPKRVAPAAPSSPGPTLAMSRDGAWLALGYETSVSVLAIDDPSNMMLVANVPQLKRIEMLGWTPGNVLIVHVDDAIVGWSPRTKGEVFRSKFAGLSNATMSPDGTRVAVAHGAASILQTSDQERIALHPLEGVVSAAR